MSKVTINGEIYSKEHYDKIFAEIEQLPDTLSPEEISFEIQKRINLTILIGQSLGKSIIETLQLYRLRVPEPNEKIEENEISAYSYPPDKNLITKKGRANIEKQQVFYASADGHTPFHEMTEYISPGSTIVYLSKWGVKNISEPVFMRNLFLGVPEDNEKDYSSIMAKGLKANLETILSGIPEALRENYIYGQRKYAELFTSTGKNFYHLSSAIAYNTFVSALKQKADIPILTYPSVAKNKSAINFAIRKDFADRHLYLKEVMKVIVKKLGTEEIEVTVIAKGLVSDSKMEWFYPKMNVKYNTAFVSPDDNVKNMRNLKPEESFTMCCKEHTMNTIQLFEKIKLTESYVLDQLSDVPMSLDSEKPHIFDSLLFIPINFNLYLNSDISEKGKINHLMVPVRGSFSYEKLVPAIK